MHTTGRRPRNRDGQTLIVIQRASRAKHIPTDARIRKWARAAMGRDAQVTIRYVAGAEGRRLNKEYRRRDYATNVLTFIYGKNPLAGDVVICAPIVAREADEQGKGLDAHHAHMLVHGLLHLQGFDHENDRDAQRMERRERTILARLGFADPYVRPE